MTNSQARRIERLEDELIGLYCLSGGLSVLGAGPDSPRQERVHRLITHCIRRARIEGERGWANACPAGGFPTT